MNPPLERKENMFIYQYKIIAGQFDRVEDPVPLWRKGFRLLSEVPWLTKSMYHIEKENKMFKRRVVRSVTWQLLSSSSTYLLTEALIWTLSQLETKLSIPFLQAETENSSGKLLNYFSLAVPIKLGIYIAYDSFWDTISHFKDTKESKQVIRLMTWIAKKLDKRDQHPRAKRRFYQWGGIVFVTGLGLATTGSYTITGGLLLVGAFSKYHLFTGHEFVWENGFLRDFLKPGDEEK